jgi:hypothetical protein
LGWSSKLADVGVPREEALATWWTLLLMDELIAWGVWFLSQGSWRDADIPTLQRMIGQLSLVKMTSITRFHTNGEMAILWMSSRSSSLSVTSDAK